MPSTSPPPSTADGPPRRRLQRWLLVAAVALGVLVLAQAPLPAYVQRPGPAIALADAIELPDPDPVDGDFLFLTIRLDDATTWSALAAGFDGDAHVVSRDAILGGASEADFVAEQTALFESAERTAVAVGLAAAGSDVDPDAVDIRAEGVGGPSAGLLVALAVADLASTDDLAGGRVITGTGTVDADGRVGTVGSVADKVLGAEAAGADVVLVPEAHADEARRAATTIEVIAVGSVADAVEALAAPASSG